MASLHPYQSLPIDERVKRVLAKTPLIDGHNDLPQQPRACFHGKIHNNEKFDLEKGFERGMTDIPRLKQGTYHHPVQLNFTNSTRCRRRPILVRVCTMSPLSRRLYNT